MDDVLEVLWFIFTVHPLLMVIPILFVGAVLLAFIVDHKKAKERERIRREREQRIRNSGIYEVDEMKGADFEEFLQILLNSKGYEACVTIASGDYGADLVLKMRSRTIIVQAKRYSNKVGLKAVQEIASAKSYYNADECWVITNNYFTAPAMKLGKANGVVLIDRDELVEWMLEEKKRA